MDVQYGTWTDGLNKDVLWTSLGRAMPTGLHSSNVGFDGLAIVHKANGPKVERLRKDIISLFKDEGLSITIDTNLIETDFLGVSFNLNTGKYFPFQKPNNTPLYIHSKSNHPPSIIK